MHWKTLSRNFIESSNREGESQRDRCLKQINRPHIGKTMSKAPFNSRKKKRRWNGRSKTIKRLMSVKPSLQRRKGSFKYRQKLKWWELINVVARRFHKKIEHGFAYHLSVPWQKSSNLVMPSTPKSPHVFLTIDKSWNSQDEIASWITLDIKTDVCIWNL